MARDIIGLKTVWLKNALPMLGKHGTVQIGSTPEWKGWRLELDRTLQELLVTPPKDNPIGRVRVPLTNVLAYQLSSVSRSADP
jgi:hypothetical protein